MTDLDVRVPPIKSQGIKTKLVPWIGELIPEDFGGRWIEPFMGTGVVGFNLARGSALMADINPHVIRFYRSIQDGSITPRSVREYLTREGQELGERGEDHYYFIRARFNELHDPLDFLFINRAGFNGMIRFNRKGRFNIPFCRKPDRFAKAYVTRIANQVDATSAVLRGGRFQLEVSDFEATIAEAKAGDIIYCDPPYAGRYVDYYNGWSEMDELRLHRAIKASPAEFILSAWVGNAHRENESLKEIWGGARMLTREHYYHVGGRIENRNAMTEALLYSDGLATRGPVAHVQEEIPALF